MAIIISVASQKGGTGKTTTANALASILGSKNKKVLLIDLDSQQNLTYSSGVTEYSKTITDILSGACEADEAILQCKYYDFIATDKYLNNIEMSLDIKPTLLESSLRPVLKNYDFVILDTPPDLSILSYNSLVASNYVIIPTEASVFALQGLASLYETIQNVRQNHNKDLEILGILLVKYNNRAILSKNIKGLLDDYAKTINTIVFNTFIRQGIAVKEAQFKQVSLIDYAKKSKPCIDYISFADEILERIEKNGS